MTQYNVNVSCWGKIPWTTWGEAERSLKRQFGKVRKVKGSSMIYKCKICHKWHVGGGKERD